MVNLQVRHALNNNQEVHIPVPTPQDRNECTKEVLDWWIENRRGHGWMVLAIENSTHAQLKWEHSLTETRTWEMGALTPRTDKINGLHSPNMLVILDNDPLMPPFIFDIMRLLTTAVTSRRVFLERQW